MQRIDIPPRPDWREKVEAVGLVWHTPGGVPYWNESAYYAFTLAQVEEIEAATAELYRLFLEAGQYVVDKRLWRRFGIPDWCAPLVEETWRAEPPALNYGRFDLGYDGRSPPKLFEFNCDTPTSLVEAAVVQWAWKEERFPRFDQFNSLHDALVARWREIAPRLPAGAPVHFTHMRDASGEDAVTCAYLMDTAKTAGVRTAGIALRDIGWDGSRFLDLARREMRTVYKLYPWEWMVRDPFGRNVVKARQRTQWIEPIWKMIWSNKAILPILWTLFPRHPNLLWASADAPHAEDYVRKPALAREGGNIRLVKGNVRVADSDGAYGDGPVVYQGLYDLPDMGGGVYPVIGSWVVDGAPAGMGVREDGLITGNLARFAPHVIL
ncbi:glutathionylspermidine synthase family protein [Caulobacter sp. KR2-114]|uniref:glutathionylspermidine synthase family protein n=1 Tax=Caulobacter sp. KR2-114 TaxID=3400912 RepID=UPI003C098F6D